jgi:acyl carrier protein
MMAESEGAQTALEHEVARMIVSALNLEGIAAEDIEPEAPLFGGALGLDSIDALELALAISQQYGFELRSDDDNNPRIFASLRNLAKHIDSRRAA